MKNLYGLNMDEIHFATCSCLGQSLHYTGVRTPKAILEAFAIPFDRFNSCDDTTRKSSWSQIIGINHAPNYNPIDCFTGQPNLSNEADSLEFEMEKR